MGFSRHPHTDIYQTEITIYNHYKIKIAEPFGSAIFIL